MTASAGTPSVNESPSWRDFLELCKPRVVLLMLVTAWVGMVLASPAALDGVLTAWALTGIALVASSAAGVNHLVDRKIDAQMARTLRRPLPKGRLSPWQAGIFSAVLGVLGMLILWFRVNALTAGLTFLSLLGYAGVYTGYLKRATVQNIVIGGLAGAAPPLLGWVAVTNHVDAHALLLVLIIFVWTPPHFWALAIHRQADYAKVDIPMLPVIYGVSLTQLHVLLYTVLLVIVSLLPYLVRMSGLLYLGSAVILNLFYLRYSWLLYRNASSRAAMGAFWYSIYYLFLLFAALLVDHYFPINLGW